MPETAGKVPPNSIEAEQSILGSMMLSEGCALAAVEKLKEGDFYTSQHRRIYAAMYDLVALGKPVDLVTVVERMEVQKELSAEELTYLSDLTQRVPSVRNIDSYIDIVLQKSMLRKLISVCGEISDMCFAGEEDAREIVNRAGDLVYRASEDRSEDTLVHMRTALMEAHRRISDAYRSKTGMLGAATGFPLMDRTLSGLQEGQLIIIAGRPGMGKTSFALNIAENMGVRDKKVVVIFSLEMSRDQIGMRLLSSTAHTDSQKVRSGNLSEKEINDLADAMEPLSDSGLYVDDSSVIGVTEMQAKLRRLKRSTGKIDLVIIDYLQLMSTGTRTENRQQEISTLTRTLKIMAKDIGAPVILLSQLSRASEKRENKKPMLSDLRESGSIEQDADVVIFLHRDDYYSDDEAAKGRAQIIIAKQRNGPTRSIDVRWRGDLTRYAEVDYSHEEEEG